MKEGSFAGVGYLKTFTRAWQPANAPWAVVVLVHGLNSHSRYYTRTAEQFARSGLTVVAAMNSDPPIANETQPTHTVAELARANDRLRREFPRVTLPVLILHGTKDKATRPSGSQYFYAQAGSADKTLKLYDGHVHDLLNDIDKERVLADIQQWLDAHLPAA